MEVLSYVGAVALLLWSYDTFKSLVELCWGLWKERTEGVDFVRRYGKWAVITGGSQGIGQQYARFFARKGLNVAIIALADKCLEQTTKEIRDKYGVQVKPIPMDFAKGFENLKFIEEKLAGMEIGVLVNNVGIVQEVTYFDAITIENHQRLINININAAVLMSRIILPQMKQRGRGLVINMSSAYGLQPMPMTLMYGASKAFMLSFGQAMQEELRPFGVECQTVTPCFVRTQLTEEFGNTMLTRPIYTNVDSFGKFLTMTVGKTKRTSGYWMHALLVTGFKLIPADVESRLHHHMVKYILSKMK